MEPDPREQPALFADGQRAFHFADIERFRSVRARDAILHYGACARSRCADAYAAISSFKVRRSSAERDPHAFLDVLQRSQRELTSARCLRDLMVTAISADDDSDRSTEYREMLAEVDEAVRHVECAHRELIDWATGIFPSM